MPQFHPFTPPPTEEDPTEEDPTEEEIEERSKEFKQELISGLITKCKKFKKIHGRNTGICEEYENPRDMQFIRFVNKMTTKDLFDLGKTKELGKEFDIASARGKINEMIYADKPNAYGGKKKSRRNPRKLNKRKSRRKKSHKRKRRTRRY